jgi:hypothetical protein
MLDYFMNIIKILFLSLWLLNSICAAAGSKPVSIVVSGESHGMVEGCQCERDPGGGLARRAHVLKQLRDSSTVLLIDAGGFAAGDMYDSYTEGRCADSVRTSVMVRGMGYLQHDAVVLGDDDLQYDVNWLKKQAETASVPLISANCFGPDSHLLVKPYVIVKKGGVTYGITGLTSNEHMLEIDPGITVREPLKELKQVVSELQKKSDIQIVISHCGYEVSDKIVQEFPEIDLVVNGHRKKSNEPVTLIEKTPVMSFGFQGKSMSLAQVQIEKRSLNILNSRWLRLDLSVPEDSVFANRLQYVLPGRKDVYDLYIMSQCPYGLEALRSFMSFQQSFPYIQYNIRFIGTVEADGTLRSLHGESEVKEEMLWLGVKKLYPGKWDAFLRARSQLDALEASVFTDLGLALDSIEQWVKVNGNAALTGQYQRSMRLNIDASPTMYINNSPYEEKINNIYLARVECGKNRSNSKFCDSLPECVEDRDCKMAKKVGKCVQGNCKFIDAVPFSFIALVNDSIEDQIHLSVLKTTEELFPGADISIISIHSDSGKKLLKKWNNPPLPFFKFGKEVQQAHNFDKIEDGIIPFENGFTFKPGVMKYNYFPARKLAAGETIVLLEPFFRDIGSVITTLNDKAFKGNIQIEPIIFTNPSDVQPGTIEIFRQDEAFRWLSIASIGAGPLRKYLLQYSQNPGNSQWPVNVRLAGIDPDTITALMQHEREKLLSSYYSVQSELGLENPIYILRNNRELISVKSKDELVRILAK